MPPGETQGRRRTQSRIASPRHGRGVSQVLLEQFVLESVRISTSHRSVRLMTQNCCTIGEGDALSVVLDETRRIAQDNGICLATLSAAAFKT